jgi:general secretion pathway protein M
MNILDNIKSWWESLANRERLMITIAGVFVGILFVYGVIWSPLSSAVEDYQTQVNSQQHLLAYLQAASRKIQQLKAEGIEASTGSSQTDLLSLAEQTLSQQGLSIYLKQVQQPKQNQIQLTLENVPFDKLMQWTQQLSNTQGVHVVTLNATRLPIVGTANVDMTLEK